MVRGYHEKYFDNRCFGTVEGYTNPDFERLAYLFNITYTKICTREDFHQIDRGLDIKSPHLFEVVLSPTTQVIPEPAPRRAVEDQLPLLDREEFDRLFELDGFVLKDEKI